jgi:hypothetical protein
MSKMFLSGVVGLLALALLVALSRRRNTEKAEVIFMHIVSDTEQPKRFGLEFEARDSKGAAVDGSTLDVEVVSDNPTSVAVTLDEDKRGGTLEFGMPGDANVSATVSHNGKVLGKGGAQFHVTAGDADSIANFKLVIEGLPEEAGTAAPPAGGIATPPATVTLDTDATQVAGTPAPAGSGLSVGTDAGDGGAPTDSGTDGGGDIDDVSTSTGGVSGDAGPSPVDPAQPGT